MIRSILAVLGGYGAMVALTMAMFAVLTGFLDTEPEPGILPPTWFMLVVLGLGVLWSAAGGWVCARIADRSRWKHVGWLSSIVLTLGVLMAFAPEMDGVPSWYRFGLPIIGGVGVLLGGRVRISAEELGGAGRS